MTDSGSGYEPMVLLDRIITATEYLLATVGDLGDEDMRDPSLSPRWTRGHVLTQIGGRGPHHRSRPGPAHAAVPLLRTEQLTVA